MKCMKKVVGGCALAGLVLSSLTGMAADAKTCIISADSVTGIAGEKVAVPVRIADNPGFTNVGIRLDYDREKLTLESIETVDGDIIYLCGKQASKNTDWTDEDGKTYGYLTCASSEPIKEDDILFTATFTLNDTSDASASVTPVVDYIRNNEANFFEFKEIDAEITSGMVTMESKGDVNGDGRVTKEDVMLAFESYKNGNPLTLEEKAADFNEDGKIDLSEVTRVFKLSQKSR